MTYEENDFLVCAKCGEVMEYGHDVDTPCTACEEDAERLVALMALSFPHEYR